MKRGNAFKNMLVISQWYFSIIKKFFALMPRASTVVVVLSVFARITGLLAFLLPIKIVFMLGSSRTPRFFPEVLQSIDRDYLIIGLSVASLVFYLLSIAANKMIQSYVKKCTSFLSNKNKKLVLYQEQVFAESAFGGFMNGVAGVVFLILAVTLIHFLYPNLVIVMVVYLFVACVTVAILYRVSSSFSKIVENSKLRRGVFKTVTTIGFFTSFVFIVVDFLLPIHPPSLISAILGVILTRQALADITGSVASMVGQYERRIKVESLFFRRRSASEVRRGKEKVFWSLVEPKKRDQWLMEILGRISRFEVHHIQSDWFQTRISYIAAFNVIGFGKGEDRSCFFVKLYGQRKSNKAINDLYLVKSCKSLPLMMPFMGETRVSSHYCHVFAWPDGSRKVGEDVFRQVKPGMAKILLAYEPPEAFVEQYQRSHALLWGRLHQSMLERLRFVADEQQLKQLEIAEIYFMNILDILKKLPVQLLFSGVSSDSIIVDGSGKLRLVAWGGWHIEPIGFQAIGSNRDYAHMLAEAANTRACLRKVTADAFALSSLMSGFERCYQQQDFISSLDFLNRAVSCVATLVATPE